MGAEMAALLEGRDLTMRFGGLVAMGVVFYFASWLLLRRRMARE